MPWISEHIYIIDKFLVMFKNRMYRMWWSMHYIMWISKGSDKPWKTWISSQYHRVLVAFHAIFTQKYNKWEKGTFAANCFFNSWFNWIFICKLKSDIICLLTFSFDFCHFKLYLFYTIYPAKIMCNIYYIMLYKYKGVWMPLIVMHQIG